MWTVVLVSAAVAAGVGAVVGVVVAVAAGTPRGPSAADRAARRARRAEAVAAAHHPSRGPLPPRSATPGATVRTAAAPTGSAGTPATTVPGTETESVPGSSPGSAPGSIVVAGRWSSRRADALSPFDVVRHDGAERTVRRVRARLGGVDVHFTDGTTASVAPFDELAVWTAGPA